MKKYYLLFFYTFSFFITEAQTKIALTPRQSVTLAERQRLMALKLTIDRLFMLPGVQTEKFTKEYNNSMVLFEECTNEIKKFAPNKTITRRVNFVSNRWQLYQESAKNLDSTAKAIKEFLRNGNLLYAVCNDQVIKLTQFAYDVNTENSREFREELLISRHITYVSRVKTNCLNIVLNYLLNYYKYDAGAPSQIKKAARTVQALLANLSAAAINTRNIDAAISDTYRSWNDFKRNYFIPDTYKLKEINASPITIFDAVTALQEKLDQITFGYASLSVK